MSPGRAARRLPPVDAGAATPFELALQLESAAFAPACEAPPAAGAANLGSLPEHLVGFWARRHLGSGWLSLS